jgi:hypothetical protein
VRLKEGTKKFILCPRCEKRGWLKYKSVRSYYHPIAAHTATGTLKHYRKILDEDPNAYLIQNAVKSIKTRLSKDERATRSKIYRYTYVMHYDRDKYHKQKLQYDNGEIDHKPTGHRSCYIPIRRRKIKKQKKKKQTSDYDKELTSKYEHLRDRFEEGHYKGKYEF